MHILPMSWMHAMKLIAQWDTSSDYQGASNRTTQEYLLFLASTRFNLSLLFIYTSTSPGLLWG